MKGFLFASLLFPTTVSCSTFFWAAHYIHIELICPEVFYTIFPNFLNHGCHTTILLPVLLELYLNNLRLPKFEYSRFAWLLHRIAFTISLFGTYLIDGDWLYKLFEILPWVFKFLVLFAEFLMTYTLMVFCYKFFDQKNKYL